MSLISILHFYETGSSRVCCIYIYDWIVISLITVPLTRMNWPPVFLLVIFSLKSMLLDIRIVTSACISVPFPWNTFLYPFTFRWSPSFELRWVSCRRYKDRFCFSTHSTSLYFKIKELKPLIWLKSVDVVLFCFAVCVFSC